MVETSIDRIILGRNVLERNVHVQPRRPVVSWTTLLRVTTHQRSQISAQLLAWQLINVIRCVPDRLQKITLFLQKVFVLEICKRKCFSSQCTKHGHHQQKNAKIHFCLQLYQHRPNAIKCLATLTIICWLV